MALRMNKMFLTMSKPVPFSDPAPAWVGATYTNPSRVLPACSCYLWLFGGMLGCLKTVAPAAFTSMKLQVRPASVLRLATHGMPARQHMQTSKIIMLKAHCTQSLQV